VEQVGDNPTQMLILFNSGVYQEISLNAWLGANPPSLLTDNFGIPRSTVDQFSKKSRGILRG
jgi:oxalate decarboxylase